MADTWEYECPQFVDFTSTTSDHEDDDSWFEVDHEAEFPLESVETLQIKCAENSSNIIATTVPVIVTTTSHSPVTVNPPKDLVIEETRDVINQEATLKNSDNRSPLNNRSNVLTKEEFYKNTKNRQFGKPPSQSQPQGPGKENAKKGPRRVLRKSSGSTLKTDSNEKLETHEKNTENQEKSKPIFAKPLPKPSQHRRSLSAGNLNLNQTKQRQKYTSNHLDKNPSQNSSSEKLNSRRSVSTEKLNPRRSVSTDKLNSRRSVSTDKLNSRRSVSTDKLNSGRSVSTDKLNSRRSVSTEKLNSRRSVSVEKFNPRRSVSSGKINSNQFGSSEKLYHSQRSHTYSTSSLNSEKSDSSELSKSSGVPKIKPNLGHSVYRTTNSSKQPTSTELELQKIEKKRQEALAAKKLAEESLKKSLQSKAYVPVNSDRKLTVTKGFEFKSDKRLRTRSADYVKSPVYDLARILRKDNSNQNNKIPKMTVVQPFKLTENKKVEVPAQKFQTVAEQVRNFSKKTPDRFRKHSKDSKVQKPWSPPRCTIPRTPTFTCQQRSRPLNILSTKEIEEKELEEIQKYKFKAKIVDKKIFQTRTGIKEVQKKEVTIPVPFDLPGSKVPTSKKEIEDEHYVFHAKPLPTDILERVVGVKPVEVVAPTVPESPAFALKQRMQRFAAQESKQEPQIRKIKARPYVHSGIKFEPKFEHRTTISEPFTFDERIKEDQMKKEQKIQKMIEESEKVSEFSAKPIPDFSHTGIPPKKAPHLTKLAPFRLHIEERVEKRIEEKQQQLEEEMRLQEERMKFKAQSCEVVKKAPFVPQLDHKCTQEHMEFKLSTETRHAQRRQFEEQKKAREAELLAIRLDAERMQQEEEEREIHRMRQEAVHKANPIKRYKPVEMQYKSLSVTIPVTPKLSTKNRVRPSDNNISYEK